MGIFPETSEMHHSSIRFLRCWMSAGIILPFATATCFASTATLQWESGAETDLAGYMVHYQADSPAAPFTGTGAAQGASPINVAKNTSLTINGLDPGRAYYFAVTAYSTSGLESPYSTIVALTDSTPPKAAITYPGSNVTLSGTLSVTASASDNFGVTRVGFYLNGVLNGIDTSPPYCYSWNTKAGAPGTYTLSARAQDAAGNVGYSDRVAVTVVNDTTAPVVALAAPADNATVSGTAVIRALATDNVGIARVEYYQDGLLLSAGNVAPFDYSWNTASVVNGRYILSARAFDNAGNVAQAADVPVTVNNGVADGIRPTISFTAPATGESVSGTASVSASAADNIGVTRVEFYLNGELLTTDTSSPYSCIWDTASVANGDYILSARAYDAAGNIAQAGTRVTVNN